MNKAGKSYSGTIFFALNSFARAGFIDRENNSAAFRIITREVS
jgi:hypothetical protein